MALATVDELAEVLRGRFSDEQKIGLQKCIDAATAEIASEVDPLEPDEFGDDWTTTQAALANRICLGRAVEWWKTNDAVFGIVGYAEVGALRAPRDGFARWALVLGPLKEQWGFA